ncbi:cyclin-dependent protein serine/threonine kinase regulator [Malassezia pachydermatis]|uniref:Alternative cyclin pcl13 n=1 Tax=Malassezia pachydermatis TaxID=77020 RepID=A0A0M8MRH1_9BASI|nr:alternative cyclin pcl13 [Malassezia pachydermatis]KOS12854.1 alternative cyclin pcl13 [Malassezia pachydermatis]
MTMPAEIASIPGYVNDGMGCAQESVQAYIGSAPYPTQPYYVCAPPPAPRPQAARVYAHPTMAYMYTHAAPPSMGGWYAASSMPVPAYPMPMPLPPPTWAPILVHPPVRGYAPPPMGVPSWHPSDWNAWGHQQMRRQPAMMPPPAMYGPWTQDSIPLRPPVSSEEDENAPFDPHSRTTSSDATDVPAPMEETAVPLAAFGADAMWKASAEIVGLRRKTIRSGARLSPTRSISLPDETAPDESVSASSVSSMSTAEPSTPPSSTALGEQSLVKPMQSLRFSPSLDDRSADLQRLVRAMGSSQRPFPSLDQCCVPHVPSTPVRRVRTPTKREHSALLGEVSPAFRHFTHQVLAQTLLSPTTLFLALHYVHVLQGLLWPDDGSGDTGNALALLAQPPSTTPFKVLILGLMMANKFMDDNTFLNKTWHEVTGIPLDELNRMESFFLCRTQFHLSVSDSAWRQHLQAIRAEAYNAQSENDTDLDVSRVISTLDEMLASHHRPGLCV